MGRPVMLSNGSLMVGLNEQGLVHDFYYPYVGLENLSTSRRVHHKIGIWINGNFSWVDDGTWKISVDFGDDALVSNITMLHDGLQVEITLNDFVDYEINVVCRHMKIKNLADSPREVRIFMHQVFQISRGGRADTALFVPDDNYILDYKGRCCLLIYGQTENEDKCDQFAVGNYGIEGKEGTYRDAEDGELSGSAVEHGGVDSVLRFSFKLTAKKSQKLDYWIIAADSQYSADKLHQQLLEQGLQARLTKTRRYWRDWLDTAAQGLNVLDKSYMPMAKKSLLLIKSHIDKRGGIIASCDSSIYNYGRDYYSYVWPRDGAFAIWPLIRLGFTAEPKRFFEFCRDILTPEGYLMHKYQPDRAIGSTWHPLLHNDRKELAIQEDETAIVLFMLGEYYKHSRDQNFTLNLYATFTQPAGNFLATYIDKATGLPHASYDLWEEKFLTHTYTVSIVYRALLVAAQFADDFEYPDDAVRWRQAAEDISLNSFKLFNDEHSALRKGLFLNADGTITYDDTLDVSSLYGASMFGLPINDSKPLQKTQSRIESKLLDQSPAGGSPRYEHDRYFEADSNYQGNPWFVTTLWLAQLYARNKNTSRARHYIDWTIRHALPSGVLPEQIHPVNGSPLSVAPLIWSHAELINTMLDLNNTK